MDTPKGMDTDHINGNGLDNRRSNLRVCTRAQNALNTGAYSNNKSGFKGVSLDYKYKVKWRADIQVNGKQIFLGYFDTKELAYQAYVEACTKHHKEFANY